MVCVCAHVRVCYPHKTTMSVVTPLQMIFLPIGMLVLKSPKQGAQTTIHCAVAEELDGVSGK